LLKGGKYWLDRFYLLEEIAVLFIVAILLFSLSSMKVCLITPPPERLDYSGNNLNRFIFHFDSGEMINKCINSIIVILTYSSSQASTQRIDRLSHLN